MIKKIYFASSPIRRVTWPAALLAILACALALAWISTGFQSLQGWVSFLVALSLGAALLFAGWQLVRAEGPPRWLAGLLLAAAVLRLALGAFWYIALPVGGYSGEAERSGYVMADANQRDKAAWELARSGKSSFNAFQGAYRKADQYGGLLFLSAMVYRTLGGAVHQPLLMIVVTAAFSSLAVLFTWAFTRRAFGDSAAGWSAWGLALYPEAALLGSSQMREAFTVTLVAAAFYGLIRYAQTRSWSGLVWVAAALLFILPFSPPMAALLLALLLLQAVWMEQGLFRILIRQKRFWLAVAVIALLAAAGMWLSWRQAAPKGVQSPVALLGWVFQKSAEWQAHLSERASGWIQKIYDETPAWIHLPLLLLYGVVQPFLPAALIDITSAPIWRGIAIWRAIGWTLVLPLLIYAPIRAFRKNGEAVLARGLSLVVWAVILVASFRAGADQWDNVRYRGAFAGLQMALAAWALVEQRRDPDPWLRRILVGVVLVLAWFVPWELRRYLHWPWPISNFYLTLGLGLVSALLYWIWDSVKHET